MISPLQFNAATKRWGGQTALNGLDLTVAPGEVVALLGRNGAGKSTAIGLALGLTQPDAGTVQLFGTDTGRIEARRRLGVLMQRVELPSTARVHELIRLVRRYYPQPMSIEQAAGAAGIDALLGAQYGHLSGGQRRAVQFALAICGRPQVLILDEPTAAMDVKTRAQLWISVRALVEAGCAILMTSHYTEEIEEIANRVCVLSRGTKVAETTIAELRASHATRRVVCRTSASTQAIGGLSEALGVGTERDGRMSIETRSPERLVQSLFSLDPGLAELEVLQPEFDLAIATL